MKMSGFAVAQSEVQHGVKHVGVIGAGQMGIGITLVTAAVAKVPVLLLDSNRNQLEKQLKFLGAFLFIQDESLTPLDRLAAPKGRQ
jgi:3-hydroxyacyl-CoA dehydrogenase